MKQTLLIAAAALAAGVISTQAQVYSQNVVGYVNQTIPAGGYQIIGSQLINGSDINQSNGDVNATLVNGFISSPNTPATSTNSQMLFWSGSGYSTYYFFTSADASTWIGDPPGTDPAGWYDKLQNYASLNLNNGHSTFIFNHSAVPMTVTTVGTVFQGTNVVVTSINPGYNLLDLVVPISTNVSVDASGNFLPYGLPGNLKSSPGNPTLTSNDSLLLWSGSGFATYYFYNQADATAWIGDTSDPAGFYDKLQNPMPTNPQVNQGFFLFHNGAAIPWTNSFSVQ